MLMKQKKPLFWKIWKQINNRYELEVKNNYFPILNKSNLVQDKYYIYDHSNFVKKSFIIELKRFTSIYGSITYFDEQKNLLEIVSPRKTLEFEIEKDTYKNELILQITKVSGDRAEITDIKIHDLAISKVGKTKIKKEVLDSAMIIGPENFEITISLIQLK